jgi:hypothetical protein
MGGKSPTGWPPFYSLAAAFGKPAADAEDRAPS